MANYQSGRGGGSWSPNYCFPSLGVYPGLQGAVMIPGIPRMMTVPPNTSYSVMNPPGCSAMPPAYSLGVQNEAFQTQQTVTQYPPEPDQVLNSIQNLQILSSAHPSEPQQPPEGYLTITVPIRMGTGTLLTLVPASKWASASVEDQRKHLREEIDSKYKTGPDLYTEMEALVTAGKAGRPGEKCEFCVSNKETDFFAKSHVLRDNLGIVRCPVLRRLTCKLCHATGDNAHTIKYCPLKKEQKGEGDEETPKTKRYVEAKNSTGKLYVRKY